MDEYNKTKHMIDNEVYDKLIITMGSDGAKHNKFIYPVSKVEIKDTSGAGDTFVAGCVVEFLRTKSIEQAIRFGNACATKVVQAKGVSIV